MGYVDEGISIAEGYVDEGIHIADPYVVLASGSLTRPDGLAYANLADLSKTGYVDESRFQRLARHSSLIANLKVRCEEKTRGVLLGTAVMFL